jgi:Fic family protein
MYIHELSDWPDFRWSAESLLESVASVRMKQGKLIGQMRSLGFMERQEATLETITLDVLKTSEIEGEFLDPNQVRSSIAKRLGLDIGRLKTQDRNIDAVVDMMIDVRDNYSKPLTSERLYAWHRNLFPNPRLVFPAIVVGAWRDDQRAPMRVVSGAVGRERIHFQAPAANLLDQEMDRFINWFEHSPTMEPLVKAGLAHLYFVTIHPFSDGNGRIARAIADLALARSEVTEQRFYSMSAQIRIERKDYYAVLEQTQKASMDATIWLQWFLGCLERAVDGAQDNLQRIINKARYWQLWKNLEINERQRNILNRLLDKNFEGKLNTSKWAKMNKTSSDTALRDIKQLVELGVLVKEASGGRETSYTLNEVAQLNT